MNIFLGRSVIISLLSIIFVFVEPWGKFLRYKGCLGEDRFDNDVVNW